MAIAIATTDATLIPLVNDRSVSLTDPNIFLNLSVFFS